MKFANHVVLALAFWSIDAANADSPKAPPPKEKRSTLEDLYSLTADTFAIGHRGYGENMGELEGLPLENTVDSVFQAFLDGVAMGKFMESLYYRINQPENG